MTICAANVDLFRPAPAPTKGMLTLLLLGLSSQPDGSWPWPFWSWAFYKIFLSIDHGHPAAACALLYGCLVVKATNNTLTGYYPVTDLFSIMLSLVT